MPSIGIISEYNPFHSGHQYHIATTKEHFGESAAVLCVMSGNFVQRGEAALTDKWTRAGMALRGGADLVLELPTLWAVSSAEHFAGGAVAILAATGLVKHLSFGSETGDLAPLQRCADALASEAYRKALRGYLDEGLSFPLARQKASTSLLGTAADCLKTPNNNLGVEYLRALKTQGSSISPFTILRQGAAHDAPEALEGFSSATQLREALLRGDRGLSPYLEEADEAAIFSRGLYSLKQAERAVFARLRLLHEVDFLSLPDCSEGLEKRLQRAVLETQTLDALYAAVKSRRYAHARIRRLVLWAFLGLRATDCPASPPYLRVLGMSKRGQGLLREMKRAATLPIITKAANGRKLSPEIARLLDLEARSTALYALCHADFGGGQELREYAQTPLIH